MIWLTVVLMTFTTPGNKPAVGTFLGPQTYNSEKACQQALPDALQELQAHVKAGMFGPIDSNHWQTLCMEFTPDKST